MTMPTRLPNGKRRKARGGSFSTVISKKLAAISDQEVARLLRQTHLMPSRPRQRAHSRKTPTTRPWTPEEDTLLANFSNARVARQTGRTVHSVEYRRARLGLRWRDQPWRAADAGTQPDRNTAFWSEEEDALLGTMPDKPLAKKLGRSVEAVCARRHEKRISLRRKWRPDEERRLGTLPDAQVAKLLQRDQASVTERRRRLGIPSFEEKQRSAVEQKLTAMSDVTIARLMRRSHRLVRRRATPGRTRPPRWTVAEDRLVGKWPDEKVARFLDRTRKGVEARRLALGIRQHAAPPRWTPEEQRLLAPENRKGPLRQWTASLARKLGRTVAAVSERRRLLYGNMVQQRPWTARERRLLGTRPDREVAAMTGRKCGTVQVIRNSLGIPSFRARNKFRWTPAKDRLLGKFSDETLAGRFGIYRKEVERRRHALGIRSRVYRLWTPDEEGLIGTMPDAEVACRIGRTRKSVWHRRLALGLPEPKG